MEKPYWEDKEYSFLVIKNVSFFPVIREQILRILTVCFVIALYMHWVINVVGIFGIQTVD